MFIFLPIIQDLLYKGATFSLLLITEALKFFFPKKLNIKLKFYRIRPKLHFLFQPVIQFDSGSKTSLFFPPRGNIGNLVKRLELGAHANATMSRSRKNVTCRIVASYSKIVALSLSE